MNLFFFDESLWFSVLFRFENETWITHFFSLYKWFSVCRMKSKIKCERLSHARSFATLVHMEHELSEKRALARIRFIALLNPHGLWFIEISAKVYLLFCVCVCLFSFLARDDIDKFETVNNDKHMLPEPALSVNMIQYKSLLFCGQVNCPWMQKSMWKLVYSN